MNTSEQSRGALITLVSGGVLFIVMFFFKWFEASASAGGFSVSSSVNAWHSMEVIRWLLLITVILAVVVGVMRMTESGDISTLATVLTGLAAFVTLLVLYRLIDAPGPDINAPGVAIDVSRKIGAFLGLIASGGVAYGAFNLMNEPAAPRASGPAPGAAASPPPSPGGGTPPPAGGGDPAPPSSESTPPPGPPPAQ